MRAHLTVLVALTALAVPAVASAKGIESVTACGYDRCRDASTGDAMLDHALMESGRRAERPRQRAPFFRVLVGFPTGRERGDVEYREKLWAPWLGVAADRDPTTGRLSWYRPGHRHEGVLRAAIRGLSPLPASEMPLRVQLRPTAVAPPPSTRDTGFTDASTSLSATTIARLRRDENGAPPGAIAGGTAAVALVALVAVARRRRRSRAPA